MHVPRLTVAAFLAFSAMPALGDDCAKQTSPSAFRACVMANIAARAGGCGGAAEATEPSDRESRQAARPDEPTQHVARAPAGSA